MHRELSSASSADESQTLLNCAEAELAYLYIEKQSHDQVISCAQMRSATHNIAYHGLPVLGFL